jgi:hypothetical protein
VTADRNARTDLTAEFRRAAKETNKAAAEHKAEQRSNMKHASSSSTATAACDSTQHQHRGDSTVTNSSDNHEQHLGRIANGETDQKMSRFAGDE